MSVILVVKMELICVCLFVATVKINAMQIVRDGSNEPSPTIWSCYANLNHYYYSFL